MRGLRSGERAQAQAQTAVTPVNAQNPRPYLLAFGNDVARMKEVALGQLGDVNQAFQTFFDTRECAEIHDVGDDALNHFPDAIAEINGFPRVWMHTFDAERDSACFAVDVEHIGLHFLPARENVRRMPDAPPA